jgi:hypothetical protein
VKPIAEWTNVARRREYAWLRVRRSPSKHHPGKTHLCRCQSFDPVALRSISGLVPRAYEDGYALPLPSHALVAVDLRRISVSFGISACNAPVGPVIDIDTARPVPIWGLEAPYDTIEYHETVCFASQRTAGCAMFRQADCQ